MASAILSVIASRWKAVAPGGLGVVGGEGDGLRISSEVVMLNEVS